jgi:hypothetical protein
MLRMELARCYANPREIRAGRKKCRAKCTRVESAVRFSDQMVGKARFGIPPRMPRTVPRYQKTLGIKGATVLDDRAIHAVHHPQSSWSFDLVVQNRLAEDFAGFVQIVQQRDAGRKLHF